MESYTYPKTDSFKTHPQCVHFVRHLQLVEDQIDEANLRSLVKGLPTHNNFSFAFDKTLWVDGKRIIYPITMYVGCATGLLWACPDGNVVRETKHPFREESHFWTVDDRKIHPRAVFSEVPNPFCKSPVLQDGLKSPMSPEAKALVLYYMTQRAHGTLLMRHQLEFPDYHDLTKAFRLVASECSGSERELIHEPKNSTYDEANEDRIITPTHNTSQATHQKQPATHILPQPQATPTEPAERATQDLDPKHQRDLNTLLHRKSHIQSRIATRNKQAAYEDYKARRMLAWPPNFMQDVQACLSKAAKLRALADQDQKEVDAIDEHLTDAMGGEQKHRVVPGRLDHLTRFRVKDLAPEEQMDPKIWDITRRE